MTRSSFSFIWLIIAVIGMGSAAYRLKYRVQILEGQLHSMNETILANQEASRVLRAEWSLLNDPDMIEKLARKHLALAPYHTTQFIPISHIPMRGAPDAQPVAVPSSGAIVPNSNALQVSYAH